VAENGQTAWNRCDACGRFIGFAEFDDGRAHRIFNLRYDWIREDVIEEYETLHTACDIHSVRLAVNGD